MEPYDALKSQLDSLVESGLAGVGVALSGGPDSTCLAHLVARYRDAEVPSLELCLLHVNHQLRRDDSDQDEAFCRKLARDLSVPLLVAKHDVRAESQKRGESIETTGRQIRLECFGIWAQERNLGAILTGHHRGDQVETILFNTIRGTSLHGLRGMAPVRLLAPDRETILARPLLCCSKTSILAELDRLAAPYRSDDSNHDPNFTRNRIREELLPLLKSFNPQVEAALVRLASEARELLPSRTETQIDLARSATWTAESAVLRVPILRRLTRLRRASVLRELWSILEIQSSGLTHDHYEHFDQLVFGSAGHKYQLPGGVSLERVATRLYLYFDLVWPDRLVSRPVQSDRWVELDPLPLELWLSMRAPESADLRYSIAVPAESSLRVRPVGSDDRLQCQFGHASVSEILRSSGVPEGLRPVYPALVNESAHGPDELLSVLGLKSWDGEGRLYQLGLRVRSRHPKKSERPERTLAHIFSTLLSAEQRPGSKDS